MSKLRDSARTPPLLLENITELFSVKIGLDVAASEENAVCRRFYSLESSGLEHGWKTRQGHLAWCNPPYSKVMPWAEKAIEEIAHGNESFLLLKNDPSTQWFRVLLECIHSDIYLLTPRVNFLPPDGVKYSSNNFSSVLFHLHVGNREHVGVIDWKAGEFIK